MNEKKEISLSEWEYAAQTYMFELGGNYYDIWMMLKGEYVLNKEGTPEHKMAKFLIEQIRLYVDILG